MPKTVALAFGHSHLGALQSGYERFKHESTVNLDVHFKPIWGLYHPFVRQEGTTTIYSEALESDLMGIVEQISANVIVAAMIGSEHFAWAVQGQTRPFDILLPFSPGLPVIPGAEIIPYRLIRQVVYNAISEILNFHGRIQSLAKIPVYQVLPPPPIASQERLLGNAPQSLHDVMLQTGIPHWIIRYKLWLLWISVATEIADRSDVKFIAPPEEVCDNNGLLLERYCADAVHGNDEYGCLIWRSFERLSDRWERE